MTISKLRQKPYNVLAVAPLYLPTLESVATVEKMSSNVISAGIPIEREERGREWLKGEQERVVLFY